ncbi:hypothetical protein AiwAL_05055 [Acidiphilium sp. AL]|uniref:hypothetical protein n=1 Tax=Acidiphilium sp. AL TaxID=2871704 RepID=UPI0021CB5D73|nr:hypothetical protein [Acidiphilium sp. AL]MCU4159472.1 hypothetical protein [Acidiphilium sp. AL]
MKPIVAILIALALPAAASAAGATKASAAREIALAKAKLRVAASMNDQWTPTVAALKQAETAERKGDFATAQAKAMRARKLAELSIAQAMQQKKLWVNEVPR